MFSVMRPMTRMTIAFFYQADSAAISSSLLSQLRVMQGLMQAIIVAT
jgi:hypothetical protein